MTPKLAREVISWRYEDEYAIYNWQDGDNPQVLLDSDCYAVINTAGSPIGFFQFGADARIPTVEVGVYSPGVLDMGLGLGPQLCGLGLGMAFTQLGVDFAREIYGARGIGS